MPGRQQLYQRRHFPHYFLTIQNLSHRRPPTREAPARSLCGLDWRKGPPELLVILGSSMLDDHPRSSEPSTYYHHRMTARFDHASPSADHDKTVQQCCCIASRRAHFAGHRLQRTKELLNFHH